MYFVGDMDAPVDLDARLKGEILGSLSLWEAEYSKVRLDLAWTVAQMLLKHIARQQPLDVYLEFIEKISAILGDEAAQIRQVIEDARRQRAH